MWAATDSPFSRPAEPARLVTSRLRNPKIDRSSEQLASANNWLRWSHCAAVVPLSETVCIHESLHTEISELAMIPQSAALSQPKEQRDRHFCGIESCSLPPPPPPPHPIRVRVITIPRPRLLRRNVRWLVNIRVPVKMFR